jgi:hypothetical protein
MKREWLWKLWKFLSWVVTVIIMLRILIVTAG